MLEPGAMAPEFVLNTHDGTETSLSSLLQIGPLILYFYPADFTPGCTKEACAIRDIHDDIQSVGLTVAGVSPQDEKSHQRFRDEHDLPFILLSDPEKVAIKMYEVDGPFGVGVRRAEAGLVALHSDNHTAGMRRMPMLPEVNALPGTKNTAL